jgi:GTP1/Obg family GTP-binding protein
MAAPGMSGRGHGTAKSTIRFLQSAFHAPPAAAGRCQGLAELYQVLVEFYQELREFCQVLAEFSQKLREFYQELVEFSQELREFYQSLAEFSQKLREFY